MLEETLERNREISRFLGCVNVDDVLNMLSEVHSVDKDTFQMKEQRLSIYGLIPTQGYIERCKYELVSEPLVWDKDTENPKKDEIVNLLEEPIVVLQVMEGSRSAIYIMAGHIRAKRNYDIRKETIPAITLVTYNPVLNSTYQVVAQQQGFDRRGLVGSIKIID